MDYRCLVPHRDGQKCQNDHHSNRRCGQPSRSPGEMRTPNVNVHRRSASLENAAGPAGSRFFSCLPRWTRIVYQVWCCLHIGKKSIASFGDGLNKPRGSRIVAQDVAQLADGVVDGMVIFNELAGRPQRASHILSTHDFPSTLEQDGKYAGSLIGHTKFDTVSRQLTAVSVKS